MPLASQVQQNVLLVSCEKIIGPFCSFLGTSNWVLEDVNPQIISYNLSTLEEKVQDICY